MYHNYLTEEDYSYTRIIENGGSKELADKYLAYENTGVKALNDLWDKVTTSHKVMGELFDLINKKCGLNLHYTFKVSKNYRGEQYVEYESVENLAENDPLIALAWKSMKVTNFNGGRAWMQESILPDRKPEYHYVEPEDIDYSVPIKVGFNIDIEYHYESIEGGSNGNRIGRAWYDGENWEVRLEKEERHY